MTIAGGVTTAAEIAKLDDLGADAQLGMALYTGRLSLAEALTAPTRSDRPDGLWPTVVVDQHQRALGLFTQPALGGAVRRDRRRDLLVPPAWPLAQRRERRNAGGVREPRLRPRQP